MSFLIAVGHLNDRVMLLCTVIKKTLTACFIDSSLTLSLSLFPTGM